MDIPYTLNSIIYATKQPTNEDFLTQNFVSLAEKSDTHPLLLDAVQTAWTYRKSGYETTTIFTDDKAPIEWITNDMILRFMLSGEVDIGLVAVPTRDKRLDVYDFVNEPMVLACSPKHAFAHEQGVDMHRLQFERFVAFEKGVPTRVWIDSMLSRYNMVIRPAIEFDNIETIKRAIEINSGVSILPETTISQEVASRTLCAVPFLNEAFSRPTGIVVRKGKVLGQAGRYFIDLMRGEVTPGAAS